MDPKFGVIFLEDAMEYLDKLDEKTREKVIYNIDKSKKDMKRYTLEAVKNKYIGEEGTEKRDQYELDLKLELIGELIRKARKERNLTQSQLGELIGVQKAQISKLENSSKNVSIGTIIRVFEALKANVKLKVEFLGQELEFV